MGSSCCRKCLVDRHDQVPDEFATEELMCLRKAFDDPREAPLSTETPRSRREEETSRDLWQFGTIRVAERDPNRKDSDS